MFEVIIYCHGCANHVKHHLDEIEIGEIPETKFTSFNDAVQHAIKNPSHYMTIEVRNDSEDI